MTNSRTPLQILQEDSPTGLLTAVLKYRLLQDERVASYTRGASKVFHQKILAHPSLGYWPHIKKPRTFNEKVLHRMLFEKDSFFTTSFDKIASRNYVSEKLGYRFLPEIYHVSDDVESIPFQSLPEQYVIKLNIGQGDVLLIDSKKCIDIERIKEICSQWLADDYYQNHGIMTGHYEVNPDDSDQAIMIEERLTGKDQELPRDYKFYVFHGQVKFVHVDFNRSGDRSMRFFDRGWTPQEFRKGGHPLGPVIDRPECFNEMVEIAETLAKDTDFMRIDLYITADNRIIFGELTHTPGRGESPFDPRKIDFEFGNMW